MLGHKRIPSREGGVEIVVDELATRMASLGHDVTCFNRTGHHVSGAAHDREVGEKYQGVTLKNVWTLDKRGLAAMTASYSAAIRAALGRYDVVHFHAEGPCAAMWIPKLFGKKCIATIHGLDHKRAKWGKFASWYIRTGEKCAVRFADDIIVLSESVQRYFKETYQRDTVLIPNGVSRPQPADVLEITQRFGLKKDDYLLFLGRLVPEKGVHYLIEAFREIKADKTLVIAGGASDSSAYERELRALAQADPRVIFTGFVQGRILEELYANAYVYVLPSDLEGMPLSLLEAMSFGNCCLTSDIPECADVIGEYGVTFRKSNVPDLRNKLQELCDSPHTVSLFKEQASNYICSRFNWDDVTGKTLRLYGADVQQPSAPAKEKEYENITR
ncbi:MAG: glycosyltransferase family 4 protein [Clostridia bacterium]|nr:glycosyltransferase family 4 protein [Clostridia bacterium]